MQRVSAILACVVLLKHTTRHFLLLDVTKGREIPPFSHSKRKTCRVHVHKLETRDPWLFLKVSRTGNCCNKVLPFPWITFSGDPLLEDTRSVALKATIATFLGQLLLVLLRAKSGAVHWQLLRNWFFCRNQQWSFEMIGFASISWILLSPTRAGVSLVPGCSKL